MIMKYVIFFALAAVGYFHGNATLMAQTSATIQGKITDEEGQPVQSASITVQKTMSGALSNAHGEFSFPLKKSGTFVLIVKRPGYEQQSHTVQVQAGQQLVLALSLRSIATKTGNVVVAASGFSSEQGKGIVLSAREILTTPGGAADLFQALKTMPGMTQVSESAELYVRGGDPTESLTMMDGATLYNPFTFESNFGGLFSNINTSVMRGMYFSSGGFSAKYGNALSGVLDIQSKDEPVVSRTTLGVSLANASLSSEIPIVSGRLGVMVNARHTFTGLLFGVNGGRERFTNVPVSRDGNILLNWRYSGTGRLKLFVLLAGDELGVMVQQPGFESVFSGTTRNTFINLAHSDILGENLLIKSSFSLNQYDNHQKISVIDIQRNDDVWKLRIDAEKELTPRLTLNFGAELEQRSVGYNGEIALQSWNSSSTATTKTIAAEYAGKRAGAYAELLWNEVLFIRNLALSVGLRMDGIPGTSLLWCDPRLNLAYNVGEFSTIKFSWGIFHQAPDPRLIGVNINNDAAMIEPMKAIHYVLGYDYTPNDKTNVRVELYDKEYSALPLQLESGIYNSAGYGWARGVDAIAKLSSGAWSGWISYGYLHTRRRWLDDSTLTPGTYDITHNLTIISKYDISSSFQVGVNFKVATGRPFTPVTGTTYHANEDVYEPLYGAKNSERYPTYRRLDLRLTYLTQLFGQYFSAIFLEGLNILNIENIFGYHYSRDYTQRSPNPSYFGRRMLVLGCTVTF